MAKKINELALKFKKNIGDNKMLAFFIIGGVLNSYILRLVTLHQLFSLSPILIDLFILLIISCFSFLIKKEHKKSYFFILAVILSFICIINRVYYNYYNSYASISFIPLIWSNYDTGGVNVLENVFSVTSLIYIWFPLVMLLPFLKDNNVKKYNFKKHIIVTIFVGLLSLFTLFFVDIASVYSQWNREYIVSKFGIYYYQINDTILSVGPGISNLFGNDQAKVNFTTYFEERNSTPKKNAYSNILKDKNIIFIHAESIQTIAMNTEFNGNEVTPVLNKLSKTGLFFSKFYSQVAAGTSSDTEFTLATSLMPTANGSVFINYYDRTYVTIPKLLKEKGYNTFSMHANNGSFWNRNIMHPNLGYDTFYDKSFYDLTKGDNIGFGLSDKEFFSQSIDVIKDYSLMGNPYMVTMITLSNHTPFSDIVSYGDFDVSLSINNQIYPYMENTKLGNYFKSVHYADQQIGLFLDLLDEEGLLDNTVIIIYGDHDARLSKADYERFYNYDYLTDGLLSTSDPDYIDIDYYWYELNRNVPLIIWDKDMSISGTIDTVMGMYDVMPTLGNMFGFYNKYQLGCDIMNMNDNIVVFPNSNWLTNQVYYNASNNEYKVLQGVISEDYVSKRKKHVSKLLEVSNDIIVYDLLNNKE